MSAGGARPEHPASPTRSHWARCTGPPSCFRSPPRGTWRWFHGCVGWDYGELDEELRKSFEVALHAGTAAALLITLRREVGEAVRGLDRRRLALIALSFVPPAIAGYALERPIEAHLGTPATIAAGLLAGSALMALADRAPQVRRHQEAGALDALWLGVAQACALIPGVSRNGATLSAARLRRFAREDANRLSRHVALPVIAGATVLKGVRLGRRGVCRAGAGVPFAAGAAASFASTLALDVADPPGRARSLAAAVRAVPRRAGGADHHAAPACAAGCAPTITDTRRCSSACAYRRSAQNKGIR